MRTESNATKVDLNDPSPARRASLSSTDERGAPLKRAATSRLNHHRETLTSPSVLRSLTGRRRRCGHRPDGVPRVRRHHQARRRQRRARLLRKCPLPPLALPPHARSPEADRRGIEIRGATPQKSTLTRQLQGDARHFLARVVFCLGFSSRLRRARVFPPPAFFGENTKPKNSPLSRLSIRTTAQQDHRRQG